MTLDQYKALRKQLAQEGLFQAHDGFGLFIIAIESAFFLGGMWLLTQFTPWTWPFLLTQAILGSSIFRFFVLMHDCGHFSLFRTRRHNDWAGLWTSMFCVTPLLAWRQIHFEHHKWVGIKDRDPTAAGLITFEERQQHSKPFVALLRFIWLFRIPLPAIIFTVNVLWGYAGKLLAQKQYAESARVMGSALIALAPHGLAIAVWGWSAYAAYFLPVLFASFIWYESINLTHHVGLYKLEAATHPDPLPLHEQHTVSRSSNMPTWLSALFCYHFNLHAEHHLFPIIPWHHLPAVRQALAKMNVPDYMDVPFPGFTNALRKEDPVAMLLNKPSAALLQMQKPLAGHAQGLTASQSPAQ